MDFWTDGSVGSKHLPSSTPSAFDRKGYDKAISVFALLIFFQCDFRDILDAVIIVAVTAIALSVIIRVIFLLLNYGIPYKLLHALSEVLLFDS